MVQHLQCSELRGNTNGQGAGAALLKKRYKLPLSAQFDGGLMPFTRSWVNGRIVSRFVFPTFHVDSDGKIS